MATDIYGNQIFKAPGGARVLKPKKPTAKELKEAKEAEELAATQEIKGFMEGMLQDPNYANAPLFEKRRMVEEWREKKFDPYVNELALENEDRARSFRRQFATTMQGSLASEQKAIDDSSTLAYQGKKLQVGLTAMASGITDSYPLFMAGRELENNDKIIQDLTRRRDDPATSEKDRASFDRQIQARLAIIPGIEKAYAENVQEQYEAGQKVADLRAAKSPLEVDLERAQAFVGDEGLFSGTEAAWMSEMNIGSYLLGELLESGPSIAVPLVGAAVAGAATGGTGFLPTFAALSAVTGGADTMFNTFEQVASLPEEEMLNIPEYRELLEAGWSPSFARNRIAGVTSAQAGGASATIAVATSGIGIGGIYNQVFAKGVAPKAIATSVTTNLGTKSALGQLGKTVLTEGGLASLEALAINGIVGHNTNNYSKLFAGVGDAFIQGSVAGGAFGSAPTVAAARSRYVQRRAELAATRSGEQQGQQGQQPQDESAGSAYAANQAAIISNLNRSARKALDMELLTEKQVEEFHTTLQNAVDRGVPLDIVKAVEDKYLSTRSDYTAAPLRAMDPATQQSENTAQQQPTQPQGRETSIPETDQATVESILATNEGATRVEEPVTVAERLGKNIETPQDATAEANLMGTEVSMNLATDAIDAVYEARSKQHANRRVSDDMIDSLTEGLAQLYVNDIDAFNSLETTINNIDKQKPGTPLFNVIKNKIARVTSEAQAAADAVMADNALQAAMRSDAFNASVRKGTLLPKEVSLDVVNTLLGSSSTEVQSAMARSIFRVRVEGISRDKDGRAAARAKVESEKAARASESRAEIIKAVEDFSDARTQTNGYLPSTDVIRLTQELLPAYERGAEIMTTMRAEIDALEPATAGTSNSLSKRITRIIKGAQDYARSIRQDGVSRSDLTRLTINRLLEANTQGGVRQTNTTTNADVGGGGAAIGSRRVSRATFEDARALATDAALPETGGTGAGGSATYGRPAGERLASRRRPESAGERSAWRKELERSNYGKNYQPAGEPQSVNPYSVTNFLDGGFDPDLTSLGFSRSKLHKVTRRVINSRESSGHITQLAEELNALIELRDSYTVHNAWDKAAIDARIDELSGDLFVAGEAAMLRDAPSGKGAEALMAGVEKLSDAERVEIAEAFDADPDSTNPNEFMSEMTAAAMAEATNPDAVQASPRFARLSDSVKAVFRKLAALIGAGLVVMSLWNGVGNYVDTTARTGGAVVTVPVKSEVVSALSDKANVVGKFVRDTADNEGRPYIIADKATGEVHMMSADHQVIQTAPALFGKNIGDAATRNQTPAGAFTLKVIDAPASYGGDVAQFSTTRGGDIFAIHRVLNVKGQDRVGRLATDSATDNRISNGCVNVPTNFYDAFIGENGAHRVYVVPDQKSVSDVFFDANYANRVNSQVDPNAMQSNIADNSANAYTSSLNNQPAPARSAEAMYQGIENMTPAEAAPAADVSQDSLSDANWAVVASGLMAGGAMMGVAATGRGRTSGGARTTTGKAKGGAKAKAEPKVEAVSSEPINESPAYDSSKQPSLRTNAPSGAGVQILPNQNHAWSYRFSVDQVQGTPIRLKDELYLKGAALFTAEKQAALTKFVLENYQTNQAHVYQDPLVQSFATIPGRKASIVDVLATEFAVPIMESAEKISNRLGKPAPEVLAQISEWVTMDHIPEANAKLLERMMLEREAHMQSFQETSNIAMGQKHLAALAEVDRKIRLFQESQAQGKRGEGALMAGGLTDAEARAAQDAILQSGLTMEELQQVQRQYNRAFNGILEVNVEQGVIPQETVEMWKSSGFKNYVPLYVEVESGKNSGLFHTRGGSTKKAKNAFEALFDYIDRSGNNIAHKPFVENLSAVKTMLDEAGKSGKIFKEEVPMDSADAGNGWVMYQNDVDPVSGFTMTKKYRVGFADPKLNETLRPPAETPSTPTKVISALTRTQAKILTAYVPSFAPLNAIRDIAERTVLASSIDVNKADGTPVNRAEVMFRTTNLVKAPGMLADVGKALLMSDYDSKYGAHLKELRELGGLSQYSMQTFVSEKGVKNMLKSKGAAAKLAGGLDTAARKYNDVFGAVAPLSHFIALKEAGVAPDIAAGVVLNVMNFGDSGSVTKFVEKYFPFANSTFTSGGNLLSSLGLGVGKDFFSASNAVNLARVGGLTVTAYIGAGLVREMMGTDENGEYRMDNLSLMSLRGGIPLSFGSGESAEKVPIGFGLNQLIWTWGVMLDRVNREKASAEDVIFESVSTMVANGVVDPTPNYSFRDDPIAWVAYSAMPQVLKGFTSVATNRGYFGNEIAPRNFDRDSGPKSGYENFSTPPAYQNMAKALKDLTGIDVFPDTMKEISRGLLQGPAQGVTKVMEAQGEYFGKNVTNTDAITFALGLNRFQTNARNTAQTAYYDRTNTIRQVLASKNVYIADDLSVRGLRGQERLDQVKSAMYAQGFTNTQVSDVMLMIAVEKEISDANSGFTDELKSLRNNGTLTEAEMKRIFAEKEIERSISQRELVRSINLKNWRQ